MNTQSWVRNVTAVVFTLLISSNLSIAVAGKQIERSEAEKKAIADRVAAAAVPDLKPHPSEMAAKSTRNLLLGLAQAGEAIITVGDRGNILRSTDGRRWYQVSSPSNSTLTAVAFANANEGWVVGHDATILHSNDGGKTWSLQHFAPSENKPLFNITVLDAQHAYALGAYGLLLYTQDGGATWAAPDAAAITDEGMHLNAMVKLGNGDLFVVGEAGLAGVYGVPPVAATAPTDASSAPMTTAASEPSTAATTTAEVAPSPAADTAKWTRLGIPYEGSLFGVVAQGERGAIAYGLRGHIFSTQDVYTNEWTKVQSGTVQSLFGSTRLDEQRTALVGGGGAVMMLSSNGQVRPAISESVAARLASGTISAAVPIDDGLLLAGDMGVIRVPLAQ